VSQIPSPDFRPAEMAPVKCANRVRQKVRLQEPGREYILRGQQEKNFLRSQLSADLPVADANPFVGRQLIQSHRAARADFVGADADFRAHAEFATVSESR